jgi:hypothetical protein
VINDRSILHESNSLEATVSTMREVAVMVRTLKHMGYNPAPENNRVSRGADRFLKGLPNYILEPSRDCVRFSTTLDVRMIMKRHHRVAIAVGDACGSTDVRQSNGANVDCEKDGWNFRYLSPLRLLCFPPIRSRSRS